MVLPIRVVSRLRARPNNRSCGPRTQYSCHRRCRTARRLFDGRTHRRALRPDDPAPGRAAPDHRGSSRTHVEQAPAGPLRGTRLTYDVHVHAVPRRVCGADSRKKNVRRAGPAKRTRRLEGDQSAAHRTAHGIGPVRRAELSRDRRDMELHRLVADVQPLGDRFVGQSFREEFQDLNLPGR